MTDITPPITSAEAAQRAYTILESVAEQVRQALRLSDHVLAAGLPEPRPLEWRCFHCDEVFTDAAEARLHFGAFRDCEPICGVTAERYREVEQQLHEYRTESDAQSKVFYSLGGDHAQRERRAEEKGYERGLRDAMDMRWVMLAGDEAP